MKGKRAGALLLSVILTASLLGGCSSGDKVAQDMIPTVTDLRSGGETAEAAAVCSQRLRFPGPGRLLGGHPGGKSLLRTYGRPRQRHVLLHRPEPGRR